MSVPECVYVHVPGPEGCPDRGAPGVYGWTEMNMGIEVGMSI